ncbi:hypothetical protein MCAV_02310 [[Mycoplasma] cavipharyngis]|uniref:Mbov_0400 family ICE element protein n=1 Tax=[Mycoplasma] cavipharyngis TaxID=92757 RepID=UPI0037040BFD
MNLGLKLKTIFTNRKAEITFNELGKSLDHHPIIIYYSEVKQEYYYLKIRSARDDAGNLKKIKNKEIFVPKNSNEKQLLYKDSYVDTTKIFKIKKEELDQNVDLEEVCYIEKIDPVYGLLIYDTLIENLKQQPPLCSLITVSFNQNIDKFTSKTEYTHRDLVDSEYNELKKEEKPIYDEVYQSLIKNRCKTTLEILENCQNLESWLYNDRSHYRDHNRYHINKNTEFCNQFKILFKNNWNHFQNKNLSNEDINDSLEKFDRNLKYLLENKYVPLEKTISREETQNRELIFLIQWLKNLDQTKLILNPKELVTFKKNPNFKLAYEIADLKTKKILFEHLNNQGIEVDLNDNLKEKYYPQYMIINQYIQKVNLEYLKNKSKSYER